MTGYFEGGPNNQIQSSGVFYYVKETGSQLEASPQWHFDIVGFNGSYGFSGYTSSAGSHSHTMALDNTGGNEAHKLRRVYVEIPHSGSTSSAGSHDHSRGTIGNSMTGSAVSFAMNDKDITPQSSGVFSWGSVSSLKAGGSWDGSKSKWLDFNGSYGFSGYTSSAGSHDHSRGTIGNSMTGYFGLLSLVHGDEITAGSGVFSVSRGSYSHKMFSNSSNWGSGVNVNFYGSSGFSGYTSSAGSHDHSRGTIGNSMTGSTGGLCWPRDEDRSGVFTEYFSNRKIPDGVSYANSAVRFNGSYGFSGYTSSAGSHDHSRGTIGNSMTGYFSIRPNCYDSVSGVFSRTSSSSCGVVYGSKDSGAWERHSFNGSYGFSG